MRRSADVLAVVSLAVVVTGCGVRHAHDGERGAAMPRSQRPSMIATAMTGPQRQAVPNPGTGRRDPRVLAALLTRFEVAREAPDLPAAVVALPVTDRGSMFISLRQVSSPLVGGGECDRLTGGMFVTLLHDNTGGVQLGVTRLTTPMSAIRAPRPQDHLIFSEAVITGPPETLDRLGDPRVPGSCGHLTGYHDGTGRIQPLPVPRLGDRSWAYRITGTEPHIPIWQWVEVVRSPRCLIEVRIPNQGPAPRTDPAKLLPLIAESAYQRAETALR